ncbi:hypothetical protein LWF15_30555 [Kineosporia rhizophila]|uniref:hypothetical protein n=1 Tax=Kineosporia rhizophila TaxID=84633 RepID=UPI001E6535FF|nr:hypothetical protein [Kineosporia rhizophila]MCE0539846.1 hypothetical protein [Kineosporia rhizophila]
MTVDAGAHSCDCLSQADAALDDDEPDAGLALLTLVLGCCEPADAVLARVKRGLRSRHPQVRASALQSLGHFGRLYELIDADSVRLLRRALRDRTVIHGVLIRSYAQNAADDVGMFVPRWLLPRWLRRQCAGPRRGSRVVRARRSRLRTASGLESGAA